jgi:hypothetical protein
MNAVQELTSWAGGLVLAVSLLASRVAADTTAIVVDSQGNSVELTDVVTTSFEFQVDDAHMNIAVTDIKRIDSIGLGGPLKVELTNRCFVLGTSESRISGQWRLGTYTLDVSNSRSIVFHHTTPTRWTAIVNGWEVDDLRCQFPFFGHDRDRASSNSASGENVSARLPVVIRDALYFIPFSRIEHATPTSIKLTGRTAPDDCSFGRSRILEGAPGKLLGKTKLGAIEISLDKVTSIQFDQIEEVPTVTSGQQTEDHPREPDCCDKVMAVITTRKGDNISVSGLQVLTANSGGYRGAASSRLACRSGDSRHNLELSELGAIHDVTAMQERYNAYSWKLRITATVVTDSAAPIAVELENPDIYFAGASDLGDVVIRARDVARIDFHSSGRGCASVEKPNHLLPKRLRSKYHYDDHKY